MASTWVQKTRNPKYMWSLNDWVNYSRMKLYKYIYKITDCLSLASATRGCKVFGKSFKILGPRSEPKVSKLPVGWTYFKEST